MLYIAPGYDILECIPEGMRRDFFTAVMDWKSIYISDISSEGVMCLILLFLMVTCLLKKNRTKTVHALMIMISADLLLMICQMLEWSFMILSPEDKKFVRTAQRVLYTADYSLYYFISAAFFNYITEHVKDMKKDSSPPHRSSRWLHFLIVWGAAVTVAFAFLMNQEWFWFVNEDGREMFDISAYLVMYLLGTAGTVSSVAVLVRNRRVLGKLNFALLISYIITPYIFVIPDLADGTCIAYLMISFYTFILYVHIELRLEKELAEKEELFIRQEKELTELNTKIVLSQMQPHFLYNTLSTISGLCYMEGAVKARNVVDKFSEYFRENLDAMGNERFISFEKELKHIETYLWIEQIRFEGSLNVEYDIGVSDFTVPSLSVQPLVENAVKHGIRRKKGGGTVRIETEEKTDEYLITVSDDGVGYIAGTVPDDGRSHLGIENIKTRLDILCGGVLETDSKPGKGTAVTLHIPKRRKEE